MQSVQCAVILYWLFWQIFVDHVRLSRKNHFFIDAKRSNEKGSSAPQEPIF